MQCGISASEQRIHNMRSIDQQSKTEVVCVCVLVCPCIYAMEITNSFCIMLFDRSK